MNSRHFWAVLIIAVIGTLINFWIVHDSGSRNPTGARAGYVGTGAWHK